MNFQQLANWLNTGQGVLLSLYFFGVLAGLSRLRYGLPWSAPLYLPGTLLHEAAHFVTGLLLGANPSGFSFWPSPERNEQGRVVAWRMGQVTLQSLNWLNAVPTALAPAGLLWFGYAYGLPSAMETPHLQESAGWLTLTAYCFWSGWPSPQDWRIVGSSPASVGFYVALGWIIWQITA